MYAAVRFPSREYSSNGNSVQTQFGTSADDSVCSLLQECRLMRKDELLVVKSGNTPRVPDCFQRSPRKVNIADTSLILTMAVDGQGNVRTYLFLFNELYSTYIEIFIMYPYWAIPQ